MSLLPEIILRHVLVQGIADARRDDETLDILFRNTPREVTDSLKAAFKEMKIKVMLNYPREDIHLPCISILLRGEDETEPVLGDVIGEGYGPGPGDSKIREEHFYTPNETADVDDSPLSSPTSRIIGEPRKLFVDDGTLYKRSGVGDEASYLVHVLASKPETTIFLYVLCKYIFRKNRMVLEANGLQQFTLSGTDFAPQPTHLPTYTYSRALSCRFLYWFDWMLTQGKDGSLGYGEDYASAFDIEICAQEGDDPYTVTVVDVLSQPPSLTSITASSVDAGSHELLIVGVNIQNEATVSFTDSPYVEAGPTGIEIITTEYISDNRLRINIFVHPSSVSTDVVVTNPDLQTATLTAGLTVT